MAESIGNELSVKSAGTQCAAYCPLNRFYSCDGVPIGLHMMSLNSQAAQRDT